MLPARCVQSGKVKQILEVNFLWHSDFYHHSAIKWLRWSVVQIPAASHHDFSARTAQVHSPASNELPFVLLASTALLLNRPLCSLATQHHCITFRANNIGVRHSLGKVAPPQPVPMLLSLTTGQKHGDRARQQHWMTAKDFPNAMCAPRSAHLSERGRATKGRDQNARTRATSISQADRCIDFWRNREWASTPFAHPPT